MEAEPELVEKAPEAAGEGAPATPRSSAAAAPAPTADPAPQANGWASNSATEPKDDHAAELDQVQAVSVHAQIFLVCYR